MTPKNLAEVLGTTPQEVRKAARKLFGKANGKWSFTEEMAEEIKAAIEEEKKAPQDQKADKEPKAKFKNKPEGQEEPQTDDNLGHKETDLDEPEGHRGYLGSWGTGRL